MIALAALSVLLYRAAFGTYFFIKKTNSKSSLDLNYDAPDLFRNEFDDIVARQITFIGVLATAAPLLGLLGTVEGMLDTFEGLSQRTGADTSRRVSSGVSLALITTQAGLLIAIPAMFMIQLIKREANKVDNELTHRALLNKKKIAQSKDHHED